MWLRQLLDPGHHPFLPKSKTLVRGDARFQMVITYGAGVCSNFSAHVLIFRRFQHIPESHCSCASQDVLHIPAQNFLKFGNPLLQRRSERDGRILFSQIDFSNRCPRTKCQDKSFIFACSPVVSVTALGHAVYVYWVNRGIFQRRR